MLRLSRLADYAVLLMTQMAVDHNALHHVGDLAAGTGLPVPTVAKVLAKLARQGLLTSHRGVKGGYSLAHNPAKITAAAIVSALDGPIALTQCSKAGVSSCDVEPVCPSRSGLGRINAAVRQALEEVSLADIALPQPSFVPRKTAEAVPLSGSVA